VVQSSDRPTERVRHSNGKTVFESGHLISVTIRTVLVSGNSMLNFYDPNMMNITIRQKLYCLYSYLIREFFPRMKNYLYPQYPSYPIRFHRPSCACACGDGVCLSGARSHHGSWAAGATATVVDGAAESRNMDGRPAGAAQGSTGHRRSA
jgi:hypothetical protein